MQAKIHLKNLHVETLIGMREHERLKKQPLIFELILTYSMEKTACTDRIEFALDYSKVVSFVIEYVQKTQFYLLEKLAFELAQALCKQFKMTSAHLFIQKPLALNQLAEITFEYLHNT